MATSASSASSGQADCGKQPICGCVAFCRGERFGTGVRTGAQFMEGIRDDGRQVFHDGEVIGDVTTHPAFRGAVQSVASIYDMASDPENRELMTYESPTTGDRVNRHWSIPRSREELIARRKALTRTSEMTLGLMGRSPDHVAGFFAGYAAAPEVLARGGQQFADNMLKFYEFCRDHDAYLTYTIVPPQIDRSKPAHQQNPPDLYAGIVDERDDGVIIRGAQMLGTGTAISEYVQLSTIHPMRPGDENYAISVVMPSNAPGVKIFSRRSYALAASSVFDYPLASRFDETDSLLVYDDVFVPWERVFVYKNLDVARAQWFEAPAHILGNSQAQIRYMTKLRFLLGLVKRITDMNGIGNLPPVIGQLGGLATYASMYEGLIYAQEAECRTNANGYVLPNEAHIYANMNLQSEINPKMLDSVRELCGGGLIQLPSSVNDLKNPEIREYVTKYVQSPGVEGEDRIKLLKMAWDLVGSEFAGRHEQYEKFYAGAPFIVKTHMHRTYDWEKPSALVDYALSGYDLEGRKS
ncbi:MAG: 4-hydroxyphenylacetate 3-hydroxylase N-terminal domain-containing protein [Rhodospirillaceae bacterium]